MGSGDTSQIGQIVEKTVDQVQILSQKVQKLIETGDFSNVATATQAQLFMSQLSLISGAGSGLVEGFKKACMTIITRIGT